MSFKRVKEERGRDESVTVTAAIDIDEDEEEEDGDVSEATLGREDAADSVAVAIGFGTEDGCKELFAVYSAKAVEWIKSDFSKVVEIERELVDML